MKRTVLSLLAIAIAVGVIAAWAQTSTPTEVKPGTPSANHRLELSVARELIRLVSQSRSFWAQEGQAVRRPAIRRRAWLS